MTYNMTNYTSSTNIVEVFAATNHLTNGVFTIFIILTLFIVIFMSMKNYDTRTVFITASFLTLIISVLFWSLNFIAFWVVTINAVLLVGSIIYLLFTNS